MYAGVSVSTTCPTVRPQFSSAQVSLGVLQLLIRKVQPTRIIKRRRCAGVVEDQPPLARTNLLVIPSNLLIIPSNLLVIPSDLLVIPSNLLLIPSNLLVIPSNLPGLLVACVGMRWVYTPCAP